jgi:hypothetical protein
MPAGTPVELFAVSYGPEAPVRAREAGTVSAVFSKGMYLQGNGGRVVGLLDASAMDGPLTLRVSGLDAVLRALDIAVGEPFKSDGVTLNLSTRLKIDLQQALEWTPPTVRLKTAGDDLPSAIETLRRAAPARGKQAGLWPLVGATTRCFAWPTND